MPLYEYRCEACGAEEEALESFSAPSEHACAQCGSPAGMRRQLSKAGFVLSGGGWYASGYGAESKAESKPGAKADATAGAAPGDSPAAASPAPAKPSSGCAGGCDCH
jgi:putative FmdB family regulatory protein